jgi:hypothetical protein
MPGTITTYSFAVYPASMQDGDPFDSFVLDVPTISHVGRHPEAVEDAAARRAWWSAFHLLGPRGIEPEQFSVCCWREGEPGPLVRSGGIVQ